jgi:hypothetical protein
MSRYKRQIATWKAYADYLAQSILRDEYMTRNRKTVEAILSAGTALAYATLQHSPTLLINAVENYLAVVIRPQSKAHKEVRAANAGFIVLCNAMARNALARVDNYCKVIGNTPHGK